MSQRVLYPYYPERLLWTGAAVLGAGFAIGLGVLAFSMEDSGPAAVTHSVRDRSVKKKMDVAFSLGLKGSSLSFPLPRIESELTISFDLPRPDRNFKNPDLFIRCKQSSQSKRVSVPCRVDLQFTGGKLGFADRESPFWLELSHVSDDRIEGVVRVDSVGDEVSEAERFYVAPQARPIQSAQEFAEGSPFRFLAEARWLGHDVFAEKYEGVQTLRIALGTQIVDLREKDWIIWDGAEWKKVGLGEKAEAIARIESVDTKGLVLEGWDGETHVRLSLPPSAPSLFKVRGEDLFNSIRVRSEKQISCMIEKQCLILKSGDWVLKSGGRWKILRKREERDAYQSGKIGGELFVFEKIESKHGQKSIAGFLFNADKSQTVPVDMPANKQPARKEAKEK